MMNLYKVTFGRDEEIFVNVYAKSKEEVEAKLVEVAWPSESSISLIEAVDLSGLGDAAAKLKEEFSFLFK